MWPVNAWHLPKPSFVKDLRAGKLRNSILGHDRPIHSCCWDETSGSWKGWDGAWKRLRKDMDDGGVEMWWGECVVFFSNSPMEIIFDLLLATFKRLLKATPQTDNKPPWSFPWLILNYRFMMPIPHGIPGEHFISGDSEVVFYWSLPAATAATSTPMMDDGAKVPKSCFKDGYFDVSCLKAMGLIVYLVYLKSLLYYATIVVIQKGGHVKKVWDGHFTDRRRPKTWTFVWNDECQLAEIVFPVVWSKVLMI